MRKKGIIISEPLGILIALLIMLAVFAVLYITDEQNRQALTQSIEILGGEGDVGFSGTGAYSDTSLEKIKFTTTMQTNVFTMS